GGRAFGLLKARFSLGMQSMSDAEKRERGDIQKHWHRWKAVKLVRGRHPNDPRNFKRKVHGDAVWEEAVKLVPDTDSEVRPETVRKGYAHSGDHQAKGWLEPALSSRARLPDL